MPLAAADLIGRARDREQLHAALAASGVVELVGPAGVGKSALAAAVTKNSSREVHWIDVAALGAERLRRDPVAEVLGPSHAARERALVVLDACECLEPLTGVVERVRVAKPDLTILLISRHRSSVHGARVFQLAPLGVEAGVQLFRRRAREAGHGLADTPDIQLSLATLVQGLDAIPLAIELAASGLGVLSLEELSERTRVGEAGIAEALAHSLESLDGDELEAVYRLCAFDDPLMVSMAERALAGLGGDAVGLILALRDKSLLHVLEDESGRRTLALFGAARSRAERAMPEAQARFAWRCHFETVAAYVDRVSLAEVRAALGRLPTLGSTVTSTAAIRLLERLARELEAGVKIESDLACIEAVGELPLPEAERLVVLEARAMALRGERSRSIEACRVLPVECERLGDARRAVKARAALGNELFTAFRLDEARVAFERVLADARELRDHGLAARAALRLSAVHGSAHREELAQMILEEAAIDARRTGDENLVAAVMAGQGTSALLREDLPRARGWYIDARQRALACGNRVMAMVALGYQGIVTLADQELAGAEQLLLRAAAEARAVGYRRALAVFIAARAAAMARRGDASAAELLPEAFRLVDDDVPYQMVCEILAAHLDLAEAGAALDAGETVRAKARVLHVTSLVAKARTVRSPADRRTGPPVVEVSDDLRIALMVLKPQLESVSARLAKCTAAKAPDGPRLRVKHGGQELQIDDAEPVSLASRPMLSRLLWALASGRIAGRSITSDELVSTIWPGQHLPGRRGKRRLYVALNDLRKVGLRGILESVPGQGYTLRCDIELA